MDYLQMFIILILLIYIISKLHKIIDKNEDLTEEIDILKNSNGRLQSYLSEIIDILENNPVINPENAAEKEKLLKENEERLHKWKEENDIFINETKESIEKIQYKLRVCGDRFNKLKNMSEVGSLSDQEKKQIKEREDKLIKESHDLQEELKIEREKLASKNYQNK